MLIAELIRTIIIPKLKAITPKLKAIIHNIEAIIHNSKATNHDIKSILHNTKAIIPNIKDIIPELKFIIKLFDIIKAIVVEPVVITLVAIEQIKEPQFFKLTKWSSTPITLVIDPIISLKDKPIIFLLSLFLTIPLQLQTLSPPQRQPSNLCSLSHHLDIRKYEGQVQLVLNF